MTGELAQLINLITQYNSGKTESDLYSDNSTYQYCNSLKFVCFKKKFFGGYKEVEIAHKTWEWFEYLNKENFKKLLLVYRPDNSMDSDHKLAGMVGGGGNWFIEAKNSDFSDFWQPRWEVKPNKKDEDNRIWNITYGLSNPNQKHFDHPKYDIIAQREKLKTTLSKIADFAASNENTSGWEKTFNNAKAALETETPNLEYHKDLIPEGSLLKENLQLLIAASKSFVFGGMGSWNDIGWFKDEELTKKYDEISAELYQVMNESIIAAVNRN
jgi:hypothetical protein